MSDLMLVVRSKRGTLKSYKVAYQFPAYWMQQGGIESSDFRKRVKELEQTGRAECGKAVYPYDAGIIVVDFKTRQIMSLQSGFDLFTEIYGLEKDIPKGRTVTEKDKDGHWFQTDSPPVEKMVESGWNLIDYRGDYGYALELHWLRNDLEELGIEPTNDGQWWKYLSGHYWWSLIPIKKAYSETDGVLVNPFKGLTRKQEAFMAELKDASVDGKGVFKCSCEDWTSREIERVMDALRMKGLLQAGGGGGLLTGGWKYEYEIFG